MMENRNKPTLTIRCKLLATLFILLIGLQVNSQTIKADSLRFPIGSKLNLTLELPFDASNSVKWPVFQDTLTKSIEVLSKSKVDTIIDDASGKKVLRQIIGITSFDTGFLVIPPIVFNAGTQANQNIVSTEPLLVEVYKMKIDPAADIKDIKPVMKAPLTLGELIPWLAGLLIVGLLIYGILYYLKKKKSKPVEKPLPKIKVPSWEIALNKLEELKNEKLWQKGDVKEYYSRLTDILREYFEMRYNVNASEMTSSEIMDVMKYTLKNDEALASLSNVLFLADMAKFAKAQPGAFENENSIVLGVGIVNNTKPSQPGQEMNMVNKPE
jgi:hypothetical protein